LNINHYLSGKVSLNQYAHRIAQNGASFQVHYWGVMPTHYDNLMHKHSFFEICYVVDGTGQYVDDDQTYSLQKNTIFFSRPEVLHQIKSEDGLFLLYVGFELIESESNEEWVRRLEEAKSCSKVVIHEKDDKDILLLWQSLLIQATKHERPFFNEILTNLASSLIFSLLQTFVSYSINDDYKIHPETTSLLINTATLHIKDNLSDSLKLADVARHLHISGRHLSRMFVSELGLNYSEYVQNERLQKAAELLKTTDMSIKDIAEETGFTSIYYFTRVFTSKFRSSPGRFRSLYSNVKTTMFNNGTVSSI